MLKWGVSSWASLPGAAHAVLYTITSSFLISPYRSAATASCNRTSNRVLRNAR